MKSLILAATLITILFLLITLASCGTPTQSMMSPSQKIGERITSQDNPNILYVRIYEQGQPAAPATVTRLYDYDAKVVCWIFSATNGAGISCLPWRDVAGEGLINPGR